MLVTVLVLLVVLWLFGYVHIPNLTIPDMMLFAVNGHGVTLLEVLIFCAIFLAVGILPTPLRQIGYAIVVLWVLSTLGVLAIAGLSALLVLAIMVGLIAALIGVLDSPDHGLLDLHNLPVWAEINAVADTSSLASTAK